MNREYLCSIDFDNLQASYVSLYDDGMIYGDVEREFVLFGKRFIQYRKHDDLESLKKLARSHAFIHVQSDGNTMDYDWAMLYDLEMKPADRLLHAKFLVAIGQAADAMVHLRIYQIEKREELWKGMEDVNE